MTFFTTTMQNKERFLKELTALTKRFDIRIAGCGCCGSPRLEETFEHDDKLYQVSEQNDELTYRKPTDDDAQT